jgi:hypothetical protein
VSFCTFISVQARAIELTGECCLLTAWTPRASPRATAPRRWRWLASALSTWSSWTSGCRSWTVWKRREGFGRLTRTCQSSG